MTENKAKKNDSLEDLKNIALVLGGVVVGNLIDVGAQKILKLDKNTSLSGIAEMKKFLSPTVRIVGGGAGAYFVPNKTARLLLGGVAVSGATSMVNYGLNKVLNKNNPNVAGIGEIDYQSIDQYNENMVLENYDPQLPDLAIEGAFNAVPLPSGDPSNDEEEYDDVELM